jgi:hypothetical protein
MSKLYLCALLAIFNLTIVLGQVDTLNKIITDDYPVTNNMFVGNYQQRESGEITSLDKAWFTNDTLKQTLVFELYTDYHRLNIFHFYNLDIPEELINNMELHVATGKFKNIFNIATIEQKQKYFRGFLDSSKSIYKSYFITTKGFKLGDYKVKALSIYGQPDSCRTSNGIEKCKWKFEGDYIESEENHSKMQTKRPFAENSFGFEVTMFFKADKLIAMILSNDIP